MQHHVSSLMLDFNLTRLLFFLHLNAHTIAYLNQFKLFRKDAKFRVLQTYPLKTNLVPEIPPMAKKVADIVISNPPLAPMLPQPLSTDSTVPCTSI